MKIFLSCSGKTSRNVAKSLRKWLPLLFQAVKPWMSEDIKAGVRWGIELARQLDDTDFGILCLTRDNLDASWILFEAGALSKSLVKGRVVPYLYGLKPSEIPEALRQFKCVNANEGGTRALVKSIAAASTLNERSAEETEAVFSMFWPELRKKLEKLDLTPPPVIDESSKPKADHTPNVTQGWIFPSSAANVTTDSIQISLKDSSVIKLYSIGLNFLWNEAHLDKFIKERVKKSLEIKICMANLQSPRVDERLKDEPLHRIGKPGTENVIERLRLLEAEIADPSRFEMRFFSHYPTYAMLCFDDETYIYPYGFMALGNDSPTFYWKGDDAANKFFAQQFEAIWKASKKTSDVYNST